MIAGQEIYRFDGSDEHLLEKMAEAYDQVRNSEKHRSQRAVS